MILRRISGVIATHAPISAPVRPQPTQKPVRSSSEQTRMHGVSIAVIWVVAPPVDVTFPHGTGGSAMQAHNHCARGYERLCRRQSFPDPDFP